MKVQDAGRTTITESIAKCLIEFGNDVNLCETEEALLSDSINAYLEENPHVSTNTMYLYILQSAQAVLLSIDSEIISKNNCSYNVFVDTLTVLSDYFGSNNSDLCQKDYILVCVCAYASCFALTILVLMFLFLGSAFVPNIIFIFIII